MADIIRRATAANELCQLVMPYDPAAHPKSAIAQEKMNGIRCLWIDGEMVSREGSPMECAEHCRAELDLMQRSYGQPMVFDGELVVDNRFSATLSAFRSRRPAGLFHVFDSVPLDFWERNVRSGACADRVAFLGSIMLSHGFKHLRFVDWKISDLRSVEAYYLSVIKKGGEGIVIKDATSSYYRGRSKVWMKLTRKVLSKQKVKEIA